MVRQGLWEAAIAFAEGVRDTSNSRHDDNSIDCFCEGLLIQHGRTDEAYRKYGLRAATGTTNLAVYRALARQYPDRDRRQILLDLIESRGDKSKWFAAAKDEGFLDIALECAGTHVADPSTLVRAARDFGEAEPRFAASVALMAITHDRSVSLHLGSSDLPAKSLLFPLGILMPSAREGPPHSSRRPTSGVRGVHSILLRWLVTPPVPSINSIRRRETLVFWVSQPLAWLVAPKDVPLMTRRGDLKLSHGATAKAERTP